jgi:hypothetical protein
MKGMPERPFSLQGFYTYISYWKFYLLREIVEIMAKKEEEKRIKINLKELQKISGIDDYIIKEVLR